MKPQRGAGLIGMLFFLSVLGMAAYAGMQTIPAFMDHWVAERAMKNALQGGENASADDIRSRFERDLELNNIKSISGRNLALERTAAGFRGTLSYSVKKPLFGPLSLCLDFESSTR
ncbi:MAG: DUF4845 domain-containing protein [Betaproteobacteria bacterium]|nr:DUF4845 domain-containing protein [Betaproteobacteria bacterium]